MNWIGSWFDFPGGRNQFSFSDGNRRFSVRNHGDVTVSDNDTDIVAISDGGYIIIEEKIGWDRSKIDIRHGSDGRLQRTFYRNGKQVNYEPEGRAWLAKKVTDLVRTTGFSADARIRRFLAAGGPAAVMAEVTKIESSYVKRLYLTKLLDLQRVDGPLLTRLIAQAGQEITSDYERASLLIKVAKDRLMTTDEQRLAYTTATRSIRSSYEHRRALQPFVESGPLSDIALRSALDSASNIESDYELATLLDRAREVFAARARRDGRLRRRGDEHRFRLRAWPRAQDGRQHDDRDAAGRAGRGAEGLARHRLRLRDGAVPDRARREAEAG